MLRAILLRLLALALFILTAGTTSAQEAEHAPLEVRIMTFNIWVGGELADFAKVVEAVQAADADIVGLQEATGNTRRLAEALGWPHVSERMQIISRFPLIDPPTGRGSYIYAQVRPGQVIALANVHLPSDPYGPYLVRDGATLAETLENEQATRMPAIEPLLKRLSVLVEMGMPVLLTGDFNSPSHRDWTAAAIAARPEAQYPVEWPVTTAVEAAGFTDTYRAIHPDAAARRGNTWTYGYPHPRLNPDEVIDRIDLVFAAGVEAILDSQVVGEDGGPDVDIGVLPYPSDHRGVVSTVRVAPVTPPFFVAAQERIVTVGDLLVVYYHTLGGEATDRLVITPAGGDPVEDALMWLPPYEASFSGSVTFGTGALTPGEYDLVLVGESEVELSRSAFWLLERGAVPAVTTDKATYKVGENIVVAWENAPGMRWDWLGIYAAGDPDLYNGYYAYLYTAASPVGTATFDAAVLGEEMLPPREYVARLLLDDGYSVLAEAAFTVEK